MGALAVARKCESELRLFEKVVVATLGFRTGLLPALLLVDAAAAAASIVESDFFPVLLSSLSKTELVRF